MKARVILPLLVLVAAGIQAQDDPTSRFRPEIRSHSGSPLLLQVSVPDPQGEVRSIGISTGLSTISYEIEPGSEQTSIDLTVAPFLRPGVYPVEVTVGAQVDGEPVSGSWSAEVGFVDFQFGRDNFNFGNNADYESVIGLYGEILESWLADRFGQIDDASRVVLVDYMYGLFGKRSGRCYAFAGSEYKFWSWPDLLPRYYDETHKLRGNHRPTQEAMNFLQLDMAFDHFLAGGFDPVPAPPTDSRAERHQGALEWAGEAVRRIAAGQPVVVGLMGPELHHAMLCFGYISRPDTGAVDLLVANNWKSDEDLNLRSRDAEILRIYRDPPEDGPIVEWFYPDGTRARGVDRLFLVEVRREYQHSRDLLETLIAGRTADLESRNRAVLVVEDAKGAVLTTGEIKTGYDRYRTVEEIPDTLFDKVNRTYRFEYPADLNVWLEVLDDVGARILHFSPGQEAAVAWVVRTAASEDDDPVLRQLSLDTGDETVVLATTP